MLDQWISIQGDVLKKRRLNYCSNHSRVEHQAVIVEIILIPDESLGIIKQSGCKRKVKGNLAWEDAECAPIEVSLKEAVAIASDGTVSFKTPKFGVITIDPMPKEAQVPTAA